MVDGTTACTKSDKNSVSLFVLSDVLVDVGASIKERFPLLNDTAPRPPSKRTVGPFRIKGVDIVSLTSLEAPSVPFIVLSPSLPRSLTPPPAPPTMDLFSVPFNTAANGPLAIDEMLPLSDTGSSERLVRYPPPGMPDEAVPRLKDDFEYDFKLLSSTLFCPFNMPPAMIPFFSIPSFRITPPEIGPAVNVVSGAGIFLGGIDCSVLLLVGDILYDDFA